MTTTNTKIETTMHNMQIIEKAVKEYINDMGSHYIQNYDFMSKEDFQHIASIGTSIMCTKLDIGYPGGSFVQSIVNNDLRGSFANADGTNASAIRFYVMMMYNLQLKGLVL